MVGYEVASKEWSAKARKCESREAEAAQPTNAKPTSATSAKPPNQTKPKDCPNKARRIPKQNPENTQTKPTESQTLANNPTPNQPAPVPRHTGARKTSSDSPLLPLVEQPTASGNTTAAQTNTAPAPAPTAAPPYIPPLPGPGRTSATAA